MLVVLGPLLVPDDALVDVVALVDVAAPLLLDDEELVVEPPHDAPQVPFTQLSSAVKRALVLQIAGGAATRHALQVASFTQASAWLQQSASRHWSHMAFPVVTPQAEVDPHWPEHCEVQAVVQMHELSAESSLAAFDPAVVSHCEMQAWVVHMPTHVLRSRHAWSATQACVWLWQAPLSADCAHCWQAAIALPACVPEGASAR